MPLREIETKRLYQQVADQIAELIGKGEWKPSDRLPAEREMAQVLGVSRPTVREAMIALELRGMVEVRTGSGIYVKNTGNGSPVNLLEQDDPGPSPFEILAARRIIEGEIAFVAATSMTPAGRAEAWAAIEKMEADIERGNQLITNEEDGDRLFHMSIASAARNSVLLSIVVQLWEGMRNPIFTSICRHVRLPENARRAAGDHRLIMASIENRDPEGAREAMIRHLEQVEYYLLQDEQ